MEEKIKIEWVKYGDEGQLLSFGGSAKGRVTAKIYAQDLIDCCEEVI